MGAKISPMEGPRLKLLLLNFSSRSADFFLGEGALGTANCLVYSRYRSRFTAHIWHYDEENVATTAINSNGIICLISGDNLQHDLLWVRVTLANVFGDWRKIPLFVVVTGYHDDQGKILNQNGIYNYYPYLPTTPEKLQVELDRWLEEVVVPKEYSIPHISLRANFPIKSLKNRRKYCCLPFISS